MEGPYKGSCMIRFKQLIPEVYFPPAAMHFLTALPEVINL